MSKKHEGRGGRAATFIYDRGYGDSLALKYLLVLGLQKERPRKTEANQPLTVLSVVVCRNRDSVLVKGNCSSSDRMDAIWNPLWNDED